MYYHMKLLSQTIIISLVSIYGNGRINKEVLAQSNFSVGANLSNLLCQTKNGIVENF